MNDYEYEFMFRKYNVIVSYLFIAVSLSDYQIYQIYQIISFIYYEVFAINSALLIIWAYNHFLWTFLFFI